MRQFDPKRRRALAWLQEFSAEDELVLRMALCQVSEDARGDVEWVARIESLRRQLDPKGRRFMDLSRRAAQIAPRLRADFSSSLPEHREAAQAIIAETR